MCKVKNNKINNKINNNIEKIYYFSFFSALTGGIVSSISSNFIYSLIPQNVWIGVTSAIQSLIQMVVAYMIGKWADNNKSKRIRGLIKSLIFTALATSIIIITLFIPQWPSDIFYWWSWFQIHVTSYSDGNMVEYIGLFFASVLYGISDGCVEPLVDALFSDSVENGEKRTVAESWRSCFVSIGSAAGPLTSIIIFLSLGNQWSQSTLTLIWMLGSALYLISHTFLCFLKNADCVNCVGIIGNTNHQNRLQTPLIDHASEIPTETHVHASVETMETQLLVSATASTTVPYLLFLSEIIFSLCSGMTVQFWNLFWERDVKLSPISTNITLMSACLSIALFNYVARVLSKYFGRIIVTIATSFVGIVCLFVIGFFQTQFPPIILIILYVFRTGLMNCSTPLIRAVLNDNIPQEDRAKWASRMTITYVGWSLSAVCGGLLCDTYGYGTTFYITSIGQFLALFFLFPLKKL